MDETAINAPHPDEAPHGTIERIGDTEIGDPEAFFDAPAPAGLPNLSPAEAAAESIRYRDERGENVTEEERRHAAYLLSVEDHEQREKALAASEKVRRELAEERERLTASPALDEPTRPEPSSLPELAVPPAAPPLGEAVTPPEQPAPAPVREYVVYQSIVLTERVLVHLLEQIRTGAAAEPRVALFELHRTTVRNDKQAAAEAYSLHHDRLGKIAQVVVATARSMKPRTIKPKDPNPSRALDIN